mgnify:FL=1|jgi:hypothetical protein
MFGYGGDSRHAFSSFPTNRLILHTPGRIFQNQPFAD